MTNLDSILKSIDMTLPTKVHLVKAMVFPVVMWELDYKESWMMKNWCFWAVVLEKTLESPLDCKEIQAVHPKGNKSWIFIERSDAEAETPILLATCWEELTHLKRPWCRERLKAGGEGDNRGWDGWMASPTQWTWVWVNSGCWWWAWRPAVHWVAKSQKQLSDLTELNMHQYTATTAKSLQSCPTLCNPIHRRQPTKLPRPWDSPGKDTEMGCHFLF